MLHGHGDETKRISRKEFQPKASELPPNGLKSSILIRLLFFFVEILSKLHLRIIITLDSHVNHIILPS